MSNLPGWSYGYKINSGLTIKINTTFTYSYYINFSKSQLLIKFFDSLQKFQWNSWRDYFISHVKVECILYILYQPWVFKYFFSFKWDVQSIYKDHQLIVSIPKIKILKIFSSRNENLNFPNNDCNEHLKNFNTKLY